MQGYLDNNPGTNSTATVTGLPSSIAGTGTTPYSVVVYLAGDTAGDNRGGVYTVNGLSQTALSIGPSNDGVFVPATATTPGNFIVFTGVTGSDLSISSQATSGGTPRSPFDGFQVVSGAIPEPASLGVMSVAGLGLLARRRRAGKSSF